MLFGTVVALLLNLNALVSAQAAAPPPGTNFANAPVLAPGSYTYDLQAGDLHFFRVDLVKGQTIFVVVRVPLDQDFDLVLFSPERDPLETGVRPAGFYERASYRAVATGPHYVVVYPFGPSRGAYTLEISIVDEPAITVTATVTEFRYLTVTVPGATVTMQTVSLRTVMAEPREVRTEAWTPIGMGLIALGLVATAIIIHDSLTKLRGSAGAGGHTRQDSGSTQGG
ncbi:MAG: hypothetical protein RMJ75_05265 [Nitrososphaerota archaeon]|nr:hypothetical protein [Nitrososphaerota archaeon]